MGGKWGRLLRILVQIRHRVPVHLPIKIGRALLTLPILAPGGTGVVLSTATGMLSRSRPGRSGRSGCRRRSLLLRGLRRAGTVIGVTLVLKLLVPRVCLEIRHVDKVVNTTLNISHRGLIGSESPFVVDDKFKRVLPPLEVVDVGEVISRAVHGDLSGPSVECSRDVNVAPAVFPAEDGGDRVLLGRGYSGEVEGDGIVAQVESLGRADAGLVGTVSGGGHVGHGLVRCRSLHRALSAAFFTSAGILLLMTPHVALRSRPAGGRLGGGASAVLPAWRRVLLLAVAAAATSGRHAAGPICLLVSHCLGVADERYWAEDSGVVGFCLMVLMERSEGRGPGWTGRAYLRYVI
mmetsp:Transcript_27719/g.52216  ORF Transcript_27719/g.52216 Transcript_27719/m.52216 type:complete len:349 (+) Transcript_27719:376-1422(+)